MADEVAEAVLSVPKPRGRPKKSVSESMPVEALKPTETKSVRTRRPSVTAQSNINVESVEEVVTESKSDLAKKKAGRGIQCLQ